METEIPSEKIDRLRKIVYPPKLLDEFKSPEVIKEEIRQEFKPPEVIKEEIRREFKPPEVIKEEIRRELGEYIDTKFAVLERKVRDVEVLVEQVSKWHRELLRELLPSKRSTTKQSRR
jgi:hypothetical protein